MPHLLRWVSSILMDISVTPILEPNLSRPSVMSGDTRHLPHISLVSSAHFHFCRCLSSSINQTNKQTNCCCCCCSPIHLFQHNVRPCDVYRSCFSLWKLIDVEELVQPSRQYLSCLGTKDEPTTLPTHVCEQFFCFKTLKAKHNTTTEQWIDNGFFFFYLLMLRSLAVSSSAAVFGSGKEALKAKS